MQDQDQGPDTPPMTGSGLTVPASQRVAPVGADDRDCPFADPQSPITGGARTVQFALVKDPDKVPALQVRVWRTVSHDDPNGTDDAEYAYTDVPCAAVPPHGVVQLAVAEAKAGTQPGRISCQWSVHQ